MLARRYLCKQQLWRTSYNYVSIRLAQNLSQEVNLETINLETRLSEARKRGPQRAPFMKNVFLGTFDTEFLYFPETQTKERHTRFFEWLQPIEKYISDTLKDPQSIKKNEILCHLRDLGVFRANLDEHHLGLGLNQTELTKLIELLSGLPWLGSYMVNNHVAPINIISSLASAEQKAKYLPRIATGECVPTVCFTEGDGGLNTSIVDTVAEESTCKKYWILNGEKAFVTNGHDANLFVVFSKCNHYQLISDANSTFSVFLVERDFGGISCKSIKDLVGLRENPVSTIQFNNTKVPKANLMNDSKLNRQILIDSLAPGTKNIAPQAIGILRHFMKLLVEHVLQRKHLNRNLHEFEGIQGTIGRIATSLYSMESVLYMTTGMMDLFENQDCMLEKAMVEIYCASECVSRIYEGLQIIGSQSYLREKPFIQILEDALSYTLFDSYNLESNTFIALLGLQYSGIHLGKHIFKLRNFMIYPDQILNWVFQRDERLKLCLAEHLHPSLELGATLLEKCLARLRSCTQSMLIDHGTEVGNRQLKLCRLSELATRVFVLIAMFSRSSRAYCIGLRNSELDNEAVNSFAIVTLNKIKILAEEIEAVEWNNGDKSNKTISDLMFSKKDYFAEHPLSRTY